jgi:hypothetical protein
MQGLGRQVKILFYVWGVWSFSIAEAIVGDHTLTELRRFARRSVEADQMQRLLAFELMLEVRLETALEKSSLTAGKLGVSSL